MRRLLILLLLTVLSVHAVFKPDPTAQVKVEKITIDIAPNNSYFGHVSSEIFSPGDIVTVKFPFKNDFPESMKVGLAIEFDGLELVNFEMLLCEAMEDTVFVKPFLKCGIPAGIFPTSCPIKAGNDYEIRKHQIPYDKILPGFPNGKFAARTVFYEADNDPYITINVEGSLTHKLLEIPNIPEMPGILGIGR